MSYRTLATSAQFGVYTSLCQKPTCNNFQFNNYQLWSNSFPAQSNDTQAAQREINKKIETIEKFGAFSISAAVRGGSGASSCNQKTSYAGVQ